MIKPEWGTKRTCQECDATFYDLKKDPITCPKCLAIYDEKALAKKHSIPLSGAEPTDNDVIPEDDLYNDEEFFLETPSDLLESIETAEDEYEGKHANNG